MTSHLREPFRRPTTEAAPGALPEEGLPAGRGFCSGRLRSPRARRACCRRWLSAEGADITVRQLLDQTSGLADREVPELSRPQPSSLAEATTSLSSARLVAAPGTQFNYHNPNY
jgi:hypothetical protein